MSDCTPDFATRSLRHATPGAIIPSEQLPLALPHLPPHPWAASSFFLVWANGVKAIHDFASGAKIGEVGVRQLMSLLLHLLMPMLLHLLMPLLLHLFNFQK